MIHQNRTREDKNNCAVYGICTNYRLYYFFEIDESKLWMLLISKCNYWPEHIGNIIAEFAHPGYPLLVSSHWREHQGLPATCIRCAHCAISR